MNYRFVPTNSCEMCSDSSSNHKILGLRLNNSQGYIPKKRVGISVTIQQCKRCNLIYCNPTPIPFSIEDHYGKLPEEYWNAPYFLWDSAYFLHQINITKELLDYKKDIKALDIGAGIGKAMRSMEHAGFDSFGLEPSKMFIQKAISYMNINEEKLTFGAIENASYEKETFDFITFGAVFEHLYRPSECLEKALYWLRPGGIVHIEVPSSRWLISRVVNFFYKLTGSGYVTNLSPMHSPYHLYEFDIKSFEELSKKSNFRIVKTEFDVGSIYNIPKVFHNLLRFYMAKTNTGMQLTVWLQKEQ